MFGSVDFLNDLDSDGIPQESTAASAYMGRFAHC